MPSWYALDSFPRDATIQEDSDGLYESARLLNSVIRTEQDLLVRQQRHLPPQNTPVAFSYKLDHASTVRDVTFEERDLASKQMILAGFSQGGAMSLLTGVTGEHEFAGLAALSAYLPISSQVFKMMEHVHRSRTPIFMGHGTEDNVLL